LGIFLTQKWKWSQFLRVVPEISEIFSAKPTWNPLRPTWTAHFTSNTDLELHQIRHDFFFHSWNHSKKSEVPFTIFPIFPFSLHFFSILWNLLAEFDGSGTMNHRRCLLIAFSTEIFDFFLFVRPHEIFTFSLKTREFPHFLDVFQWRSVSSYLLCTTQTKN
jgi:hypothetical protein